MVRLKAIDPHIFFRPFFKFQFQHGSIKSRHNEIILND